MVRGMKLNLNIETGMLGYPKSEVLTQLLFEGSDKYTYKYHGNHF